ncbi:NUDIX domain-containing protein [Streptomyces sp. NBC_01601]|uniref:NUDIX domain-containing protein n=1 Tax=Streptomyces sp. NBC_01601 TaxID=2975892 RepID=UPI002E2B3559|nr:NUDIX domain-containing protein [Streptomyces sp. NBC_01601]
MFDGDDSNTIRLLAARFSAHDAELGLDSPEQWTLQVLKICEEAGEAAQALIGARGTNPRKATLDWNRVHDEVADVIITSMVALTRMRPHDAEAYLRRQLGQKATAFLRLPLSPGTVDPLHTATTLTAPDEPSGVAAMLLNDAGQYLLHLRDTTPGIDDPGLFSFIRGGRNPQESCEKAMTRELEEEIRLAVPDLQPYTVIPSRGPDGALRGFIQIFVGTYNGDAHTLPIGEGVLCHWADRQDISRLPMCPWTADVITSHHTPVTADDGLSASASPIREPRS